MPPAAGPVLLGGEVPEAYDTRQALTRDNRLIVPLGLLLILVILAVLLRAVVMPLYVIATVILSFGFALGVSSLIFTHVMGQPASDQTLEQFAFIFLVALGVDYNVFLLARIREERDRGVTTRQAVVSAPRAHRRRDHERRPGARRHVQRADGACRSSPSSRSASSSRSVCSSTPSSSGRCSCLLSPFCWEIAIGGPALLPLRLQKGQKTLTTAMEVK